MRVRKSYKRLDYENWRPWQKEEYIGIHEAREWTPADDACGYQFRPVFCVPSPPVNQAMYMTPQVDSRMQAPRKQTVWERLKKLAIG